MLNISIPIIVEGKYDREKILSVAKATVITTDGFGIFKSSEKKALLRRLAAEKGVIVMTDSDDAGLVIRNHIRSAVPADKIFDIYTPAIKGKEKRKEKPSKEGLLGVEGMEKDWLKNVLAPFSDDGYTPAAYVTKTDFYLLGLSGGNDSAAKRADLAKRLSLPTNLSCSALIAAINLLVTADEFSSAVKELQTGE